MPHIIYIIIFALLCFVPYLLTFHLFVVVVVVVFLLPMISGPLETQ